MKNCSSYICRLFDCICQPILAFVRMQLFKARFADKSMKNIVLAFLTILSLTSTTAQLSVDASNQTVQHYVQNVLVGSGVTVSNVTFTGDSLQLAEFNGVNTFLGINEGVMLSSGKAIGAIGPNTDSVLTLPTSGFGTPGDNDLDSLLSGLMSYDAAVLEFDFIPDGDTVSFNYVFGSEEYPEFVGTPFNDVFGFFLSGPGIYGPHSNNAINIALIPGTSLPVTIANVNAGTNSAYFIDNGTGATSPHNVNPQYIQYDGYTTVLNAVGVVTCGLTYHIKIAIGDCSDFIMDAGVFLEKGSFSSNAVDIDVEAGIANGDSLLHEGCNTAFFAIEHAGLNKDLELKIIMEGTATNGGDYSFVPDSLVIPAGTLQDTLFINPIFDGINEPIETVTILILYPGCNSVDTVSASLTINNYNPLSITVDEDSLNICPPETAALVVTHSGGLTPISYSWSSGGTDSIETVAPAYSQDFIVTVSDLCGSIVSDTVKVWAQCPVTPPNVFTPNGDGINDYFSVPHLDEYLHPRLEIYNRWGKLVYTKDDYLNDWDGTHIKTGKDLAEGVYYYIITPNSVKYQYSVNTPQYMEHEEMTIASTLRGSVHIKR